MRNVCPFQNRGHNEHRIVDGFSVLLSGIKFGYRTNYRGFFATGLSELCVTTGTFVSFATLSYKKINDYIEDIVSIGGLYWKLIAKKGFAV